jgi:hypothetical protein
MRYNVASCINKHPVADANLAKGTEDQKRWENLESEGHAQTPAQAQTT